MTICSWSDAYGTVTYVVQNCCNPGGGDQYHIVMADGDTPRNLTMASSYSSNYIVINGNFIAKYFF